jgi:putative membrane protein
LEERIPIKGESLPWFNAMLNSTCTILLLLGWIAIRMRYETLHKILMLLALAVSMSFLASYLFYHFVVLEAESMRFRGEGAVRYVYFAILLTHTILAITVAPLAIFITVQGLRNALASHKRVARWTLPIWLYVSVTGVVVYWMLYRMEW